ncbi:MAG TPA: glycosyltransferase family 2 protein [Smithella sp.]|jgi:cellulose synthase/poly-beta-1,6-N-acetylglucosamine synthase-like glycosyltransferase|nr:glycosyltransferase family 2 protein [Smithella sp.]
MKVVYWFAFGVIFYAYIGYPIILYLLSNIFYSKKKTEVKENNAWPYVSLLIAAYNEEKVIGAKIENCLALDYPKDLLDVWIASDGSSDSTNNIVKKYAAVNENIHLLEFPRTGKSGMLNKAIESVKSEIIVFSDANTEYSADALKRLVKHFEDQDVGCVSGRLIYKNPGETISGKGESIYWRYETALKVMESKIGYIAGANGAIYAIRKNLFEPFPRRTINDDFTLSMKIVEKGFKSIYEDTAKVYEDVAPSMETEFNRHVRDGAGHYIAVICLAGLLNPFLGLRSFIYWSHRIFRWLSPFFLIFLFILNIFLLDELLYKFLFKLQCFFYSLALIGLMCIKNTRIPFFLYVPFYFCNLNLALFLGFFRAITNVQKTTWERTERTP